MTFFISNVFADGEGVGQTIQIYTRLKSFVGKPTWSLIIRDVDNHQNLPYLFDIRRGHDFWLAFIPGRNYLIISSKLQISSYVASCNRFKKYTTNNFCHLETRGRIIRGDSMRITIEGNLSPNTDAYTCHVMQFPSPSFTIVRPAEEEN